MLLTLTGITGLTETKAIQSYDVITGKAIIDRDSGTKYQKGGLSGYSKMKIHSPNGFEILVIE